MPLRAFVDSLDAVEEPLRPLYVKDGERFKLDAEGVEDVSGLKRAHEAQKTATREAKEKADELARRLEEIERTEKAKGKGATDEAIADLRKQYDDRLKADVAPKDAKIAELEARVAKYEVEDPLRTLFVTQGGLFDAEWDDKHTRAGIVTRFRRTDDGSLVVLDAQGNPTAQKPEEYVAAYATAFPHRFRADVGSGGGAARTTAARTATDVKTRQAEITRREVGVGI